MIIVYLDWGIVSELQQGKYLELKKILNQKSKFLIPYSSSHIGDLLPHKDYDGTNNYINKDLEFLGKLTNNWSFNFYQKKLILESVNPTEHYNERKETNEIFEGFSLDTLKELADGIDDENGSLNKLLDKYKDIPINKEFIDAFTNGKMGKDANQFFPDLNDDLTLNGLIKSMWKMFINLMDEDGYSNMRTMTQSGMGINRDRMFNEDNPFKKIEDIHRKMNFDLSQYIEKGKYYTPAWFDEIYNDFIMLDMHGFQEDKINIKKGRKQTMRNTTNDASHAAFASSCHFYIVKDKRSYEKVKKVYENHNVHTLVTKPTEFIKIANTFFNKRNVIENFDIAFETIKHSPDKIRKERNYDLYSNYCFHFLFDYFNNIQKVVSKKGRLKEIILSQAIPKNKYSIYLIELENLLSKLNLQFKDYDDKPVSIEVVNKSGWRDLKCEVGKITYHLVKNNDSFELHCIINSWYFLVRKFIISRLNQFFNFFSDK